MKLGSSIALVVGADSAVGTAIVRGLLARGATKVYAAANGAASERLPPGAVSVVVDPAQPAFAVLARQLADVTLLVNCLVATQHGASSLAGADIQPLDRPSPPAGRTLDLIDAFAPVLAVNGGGVVVNVLSVVCADPLWDDTTPTVAQSLVDEALADGSRDRLAAQRTQLLYVLAELAVGSADQLPGSQRALAGHVAMRVLDRLEAAALSALR